MTFTFVPAVRDRVGLVIGLAGSTGSGKTLSALKLARGLAGGDDSRIAFVDTEGGRGKHYAPAPNEAPGPNRFGFRYGEVRAPFTPAAYIEAIEAADQAGFEVVVIDSFSHVWNGDGGLQDMHDAEAETAVAKARDLAVERNWKFDEAAAYDKASIGAWKLPKMKHKRMVSRLIQCRAHLIICMRAEEKMRMETVEEEGRTGKIYKKTIITAAKDLPLAERWVPICEKQFPYELTVSFVFAPTSPGVPIPIKLQDQHRAAVDLDKPLSEEAGRKLAEWARGGAPIRAVSAITTSLLEEGDEHAERGMIALESWWKAIKPADKKAVGGAEKLAVWKVIAQRADDDFEADDTPFDDDPDVNQTADLHVSAEMQGASNT